MSEKLLYRYLVLVILTAFFLGTYLLENLGIQYASEGGSPLVKIHLYAYIVLGLFLYFILRNGLPCFVSATGEFKRYWWLAFVAICLVTAYGLYRFGTSGLAYLINTILVPILIFPMLCMLTQEHKQKLVRMLAWLIFINSLVALIEFAMQSSLISVEFSSFSHFRSSAFLTHPLNNALVTASLAPLLMSVTRIPAIVYFSIVLLALFSFGGRAAMAIFLLASLFLSSSRIKDFCTKGVRVNRYWAAIIPFIFIIAVMFVAYAVLFTPVGERIFSKLFIDASAKARFDVFILLDRLSLKEWLLGADPSLLNNIRYYIGVRVVENYAVGWLINFGLFACILLFVSSYLLPARSAIKSGLALKVTLVTFLVISLSNNALSVKTPALLFFLATICCFKQNSLFLPETFAEQGLRAGTK